MAALYTRRGWSGDTHVATKLKSMPSLRLCHSPWLTLWHFAEQIWWMFWRHECDDHFLIFFSTTCGASGVAQWRSGWQLCSAGRATIFFLFRSLRFHISFGRFLELVTAILLTPRISQFENRSLRGLIDAMFRAPQRLYHLKKQSAAHDTIIPWATSSSRSRFAIPVTRVKDHFMDPYNVEGGEETRDFTSSLNGSDTFVLTFWIW